MTSTEFKLKRNGITRRLVFPEHPAWVTLATRISQLYGIPFDRVAVSYLDADDDEVTLNTEEELNHFYQTCKQPTTIKLSVQDLLTLRSRTSDAGPATKAYYRINSMGQEVPIEDDWNFPAWDGDVLIPESLLQSSQRGYLEELGSDVTQTIPKVPSITSTTGAVSADKGKAKANPVEDVDNSSVIGVDPSPKQLPIHIHRSSSTPALAESTPRALLSEVESNFFEIKASDAQDIDDPPLPSIEPQASASLPDDISNFFTSLCSVISSHPEVSESFRNIVRNASDGTYWRTHRAALSQAATDISQASETAMQDVFQDPEVEAGRRVFSALNTLFRPLSQISGAREQATETIKEEAPEKEGGDAAAGPSSVAEPPTVSGEKEAIGTQQVPKQDRNTFTGRTTEWQSFLTPFPRPVSYMPPAHFLTPGFVPPPPPHFLAPGFGPPPPPPPPPAFSFIHPPATGVPSPFHPHRAAPSTSGTFTPLQDPPAPASPRHADFHPRSMSKEMEYDPDSSPSSPTGPHSEEIAELKAKVHAAKSMYRAEKARYLQERHHARRRERSRFRHGAEQ